MMLKKDKLVLLVLFSSIILLMMVVSFIEPNPVNIWPIAIVLVLVYSISASIIYLILKLTLRRLKNFEFQLSLLVGCIPPMVVVLVALQQASWFDVTLITFTIAIISWYILNRK